MSHYQSTSLSSNPARPAVASSTNANASTNTANATTEPSSQQRQYPEDRLARTWRSLASSVVVAGQKAERCAADKNNRTLKELDDVVVGFLRTRVEWGRLISYLEAKLEGKAQEMETLQQYVKTQPSLGRKRKREEDAAQAVVGAEEITPPREETTPLSEPPSDL